MAHIMFVEASLTGAGRKAIEYAKEQGYRVTLMTRNAGLYPDDLLGLVNSTCVCDTNSILRLSDAALKQNKLFHIDGVATTADFFVPQTSFIGNLLNLPSITYANALCARNKYLMRCVLKNIMPHVNPQFILADDIDTAMEFARETGFPIVAKPQDQNDSINVKKISDEAELADYMDVAQGWSVNSAGQTIENGVLLEGFIDGSEYSVETCQSFYEHIQLIGVTRKDDFIGLQHGNFTEDGLSFPVVSNVASVLFSTVSEVLRTLGITCGVIHTECRHKNGDVKILEVNPRLAGDMLGSHAIELALGVSPVAMLVEIALGKNIIWTSTQKLGAAIIGIKTEKQGRFLRINNLEQIRKMPGVRHVAIWSKPGIMVGHAYSNADLLGRIVTQGRDADEAITLARTAANRCVVEVL